MPIGNQIDINMRQASGTELSFVNFGLNGDKILVEINVDNDTPIENILTLESYDQNSSV